MSTSKFWGGGGGVPVPPSPLYDTLVVCVLWGIVPLDCGCVSQHSLTPAVVHMQAPCGEERLLGCAGQDVTKAFETSGHSDFAREMAKQFLVGDYRDVGVHVGTVVFDALHLDDNVVPSKNCFKYIYTCAQKQRFYCMIC